MDYSCTISKETKKKCRAVVDLTEATVSLHQTEPCRFSIESKEGFIHLQTETPEERDQWIKVIIACRVGLGKRDDSVVTFEKSLEIANTLKKTLADHLEALEQPSTNPIQWGEDGESFLHQSTRLVGVLSQLMAKLDEIGLETLDRYESSYAELEQQFQSLIEKKTNLEKQIIEEDNHKTVETTKPEPKTEEEEDEFFNSSAPPESSSVNEFTSVSEFITKQSMGRVQGDVGTMKYSRDEPSEEVYLSLSEILAKQKRDHEKLKKKSSFNFGQKYIL
eukprot:TRINITY_DN4682_c0_g1_i3.p1 TRINITY_DN4682_c0_g1~~TRINITY_DN4682_c0_g1_i3.p1  ORF type:complete len:277 (+),score=61.36 TRINITY_DN4682_c0_g1_i3:133-963(+)